MRLFTAALVAMFAAGVSVQAEDLVPKGALGIQLKLDAGKLVIVDAFKGSPADKAGLKADDVLLKVNDYKVKESAEQEDLQNAVKEIIKHEAGTKVKITVKRGDKEVVVEATMGKPGEVLPPKEKE
jgi:C-terminal processing protease CtpA/Prc